MPPTFFRSARCGKVAGRWLSTPLVGSCWLLLLLWTGVVAWQLLIGWPLTRTLAIHPPSRGAGSELVEGAIRSRVPLLEWNLPWARVWVNGRELPVYQSRKSLQAAPGEGCCLKADRVLLRLRPAEPASISAWQGVARVSWSPSWSVTIVSALGSVLGTLLLSWSRHPWLSAAVRWGRRVPWWPLLFSGVLAGALLLRAVGFAFPSWHPDSDEFLRPAADLAAGRSLSVTDRPLGYSLVVGAALRLWEDLRAVLWLHQASTLAFAAALGLVLQACAHRLFAEGAWRAGAQGSALVAVAMWGWHERILQREWHLIPEAIVPFYLALQVWLFWRLSTRHLTLRRGLCEFALFTLLGWAIYYTKPNWGLALGLLPLAWLTFCLAQAASRRIFWRWAAAGAAVYLLLSLAGLGCQLLTPANTQASLEIRYRVLVCWHLDLVRPEVARRLAEQPPPREKALLEELAPILDEERALAARLGAGAYSSLGYDADRLYYEGYRQARLYWGLPREEQIEFCRGLVGEALRRHPVEFARYVLRQTLLLFPNPYDSAGMYLPHYPRLLALSEGFAQRQDAYFSPRLLERYRTTLARAKATLEGPWPTAPRMALSLRVAPLSNALCASFTWCILLPLGLLTLAATVPGWRGGVAWRPLLPVLALALWSFGSALASALTSSLAQALEIQRYIDLFMPVSLLAQFLFPGLAVAILQQLWQTRHPREGQGTTNAGGRHSAASSF